MIYAKSANHGHVASVKCKGPVQKNCWWEGGRGVVKPKIDWPGGGGGVRINRIEPLRVEG